MKIKNDQGRIVVPFSDFHYKASTRTFSCYGNVKNFIDHVKDRSVDGCFRKSIENHRKNGTMPKMLWMHNPYELPVGTWQHIEEDSKGLFYEGSFSKSSRGQDIQVLAEEKALDQFSIGYSVQQEKWNTQLNCNDLLEVDIKETSWVNFACNEASRLVEIKSKLEDGSLLTKRELQELLRDYGLSKRQSERIVNQYEPDTKSDAVADLAKYLTENNLTIKV